MDSPIANLVQQGTSLRPDMTIQHDDLHEDPEQAILQTMQARLLFLFLLSRRWCNFPHLTPLSFRVDGRG